MRILRQEWADLRRLRDDVAIAAARKASEGGSLRADYNDLSTLTAA